MQKRAERGLRHKKHNLSPLHLGGLGQGKEQVQGSVRDKAGLSEALFPDMGSRETNK